MVSTLAPADSTLSAKRLARLIASDSEEICRRWVSMLGSLENSSYARRSPEEISNWGRAGLSSMIDALETGSILGLFAHAERLGELRLEQGFPIEEVIESLSLLRTAILQVLLASHPVDELGLENLSRLDACHRALVRRFAARYADRALAELEAERDRTSLMLQTARLVGTTLDPNTMLARIVAQVVAALGAQQGSIYLWNETKTKLDLRARIPAEGGLRWPLRQTLDRSAGSVVTARSGRTAIVYGENDCADLFESGIAAGYRTSSAVVIPIILGEALIGLAVALCIGEEEEPDVRRLKLAEGVASSVAPAIQNALQYARLQREAARNKRLQASTASLLQMQSLEDLLAIVCREARRLSDAPGAAVVLDRERNGRMRSLGSGVAAGLADELQQDSRQGSDQVLSLPLRVEDRRYGDLLIVKPESLRPDDVLLLEPFSRQAAAAIAHVLLHEQDERLAALEERQRLAHELHDSVTQSLYAATLYSETAARLLDNGNQRDVHRVLEELREATLEALRQMRLLVFEMRPPILEREGLASALEARLAAVEGRAGLSTQFAAENVEDLPRQIAEAFYGIAREAMNNVLRHASATEIQVRLSGTDDAAVLEITDNGIGIDQAVASKTGGFGIAGMKERAAAVGGRLEIVAAPSGGTRLRVVAPTDPRSIPREKEARR
jgi:signal transduction histidine kinase